MTLKYTIQEKQHGAKLLGKVKAEISILKEISDSNYKTVKTLRGLDAHSYKKVQERYARIGKAVKSLTYGVIKSAATSLITCIPVAGPIAGPLVSAVLSGTVISHSHTLIRGGKLTDYVDNSHLDRLGNNEAVGLTALSGADGETYYGDAAQSHYAGTGYDKTIDEGAFYDKLETKFVGEVESGLNSIYSAATARISEVQNVASMGFKYGKGDDESTPYLNAYLARLHFIKLQAKSSAAGTFAFFQMARVIGDIELDDRGFRIAQLGGIKNADGSLAIGSDLDDSEVLKKEEVNCAAYAIKHSSRNPRVKYIENLDDLKELFNQVKKRVGYSTKYTDALKGFSKSCVSEYYQDRGLSTEQISQMNSLKAKIYAYYDDLYQVVGKEHGDGKRYKSYVKDFAKMELNGFEDRGLKYKAFVGANAPLQKILGALPDYDSWNNGDSRSRFVLMMASYVIFNTLSIYLGTPWPATLAQSEKNTKKLCQAIEDAVVTIFYVNAYSGEKIHFDRNVVWKSVIRIVKSPLISNYFVKFSMYENLKSNADIDVREDYFSNHKAYYSQPYAREKNSANLNDHTIYKELGEFNLWYRLTKRYSKLIIIDDEGGNLERLSEQLASFTATKWESQERSTVFTTEGALYKGKDYLRDYATYKNIDVSEAASMTSQVGLSKSYGPLQNAYRAQKVGLTLLSQKRAEPIEAFKLLHDTVRMLIKRVDSLVAQNRLLEDGHGHRLRGSRGGRSVQPQPKAGEEDMVFSDDEDDIVADGPSAELWKDNGSGLIKKKLSQRGRPIRLKNNK